MAKKGGENKKPDAERVKNDAYDTPGPVVDALLEHVRIDPTDRFLEPCLGSGAIYDRIQLPEEQKIWYEIKEGRNYLEGDPDQGVDLIITNPPYNKAEEFLRRSMDQIKVSGTVLYLLRLGFLESAKRLPLWIDIGIPDHIGVLATRPVFNGKSTYPGAYAWFCWDPGGRVIPKKPIFHIDWRAKNG